MNNNNNDISKQNDESRKEVEQLIEYLETHIEEIYDAYLDGAIYIEEPQKLLIINYFMTSLDFRRKISERLQLGTGQEVYGKDFEELRSHLFNMNEEYLSKNIDVETHTKLEAAKRYVIDLRDEIIAKTNQHIILFG